MRHGTPQPSAVEIVAAAGTGNRTVFRQFRDKKRLFKAVDARILTSFEA